jgi:hypothetical protein
MNRIYIDPIHIQVSDTVAVPVQVEGFQGVSAVSLEINYDEEKLEWISFYRDLVPEIFVSHYSPGKLRASWTGSSINLSDGGYLFTLNFSPKSIGLTQIDFEIVSPRLCEIASYDAQVIDFEFVGCEFNLH